MSGLVRAEWIRFRKRQSIQIIVLAVPLLAAFMFLAGASSTGPEPPPFDAAAVRADLIAQGFGLGLPPDELGTALDDAVEAQRFPVEQMREQYLLRRSTFAFPQSMVTLLGSGTLVLFALLLLVATSLGDEFGWGTIRTTLLASSLRGRLLLLRLGAVSAISIGLLATLAVLGLVLPVVLTALGTRHPDVPSLNLAGLGVLVLGTLEAGFVIVAFGAMATLLVRSGSLTLVVLLVYVAVEAAILTVLIRFDAFKEQDGLAWVLDAFPVRGISRLVDTAGRVASGLPRFPGEPVPTDLSVAMVPLVALLVWGAAFLAIAYRRFTRMDIVE
ncbi:MAG: ABC transporter permease subunit [Chloroflexi bacterium]|nr:ABC transporter permease subunit [Chloroflexota bacterium]